MFIPIFILFILTLIIEHFKEGGDFVMFSRLVELMNSVREDTPREPKKLKNAFLVEYKFGKRIFGIVVPIRKKLQWYAVASLENNFWVDVTAKVEHVAGPAKDFYETELTPKDLDDKYKVLAFAFSRNTVVYVKRDEKIYKTIKKFLKEKIKNN